MSCKLHPRMPPSTPEPHAHSPYNKQQTHYTVCALKLFVGALSLAAHRFTVRVLIPCYKEDLGVIEATVHAAMAAHLPPGVTRHLYLCDDGNDPIKKAFLQLEYGHTGQVMYVTGRERRPGGWSNWMKVECMPVHMVALCAAACDVIGNCKAHLAQSSLRVCAVYCLLLLMCAHVR